jgi:hypothetical protein
MNIKDYKRFINVTARDPGYMTDAQIMNNRIAADAGKALKRVRFRMSPEQRTRFMNKEKP